MKRIQRVTMVLCLAALVPSCAAILGDDFTVGEDDDDGDGDGDGDGDDGAGQTSGETSGGCSQQECVTCTEQQCSDALAYCADTYCLDWEDCMNGIDPDCGIADCDYCYPSAGDAHYGLGGCICATCNASCCLSGC